jgi:histidinol-phosphatase (PHP family)
MLPPDYHMHTPLCHHAKGEPTEYSARAEELGLTEIGFSDHSPMPQDDFDDWRMRLRDLAEYAQSIERAREEHPDLTIRFALEVDYLPTHESWIRDLSTMHEWDYLIGSVHYIGEGTEAWAIDNPNLMDRWKPENADSIWAEYFDRLTQAAASGLFDIIGHADLCKKFGYFPKADCAPLYRTFLETAAEAKVAIELNTAGLRKDCREIYPGLTFLKIAREYQVPITFGSDAHAPAEVGMNFAEAVTVARQAGYSEFCTFERRQRRSRPL